jgi:hypothetical protein
LAAWVYNTAHFIKVEIHFSGAYETRTAFYSPVAAFAWFTLRVFRQNPNNAWETAGNLVDNA